MHMSEVADRDETWKWLRSSNIKVKTEALVFVEDEQALRTDWVKQTFIKLILHLSVDCVTLLWKL